MGETSTFTIKGILDISDIQAKMKQVQNILGNVKMPDKLKSDFTKGFEGLENALRDFQSKIDKGINNKKDARAVNNSYDNLIAQLEQVDRVAQKIKAETAGAVDLSNFIKIDDSSKQKLEDIGKEIANIQKQISSNSGAGLEKINQEFEKLRTNASKTKISEALDIFKNAKGVEDIQKAIDLIEKAQKSYQGLANQSNNPNAQNTAKEIIGTYQEIVKAMQQVRDANQGLYTQQDNQIAERARVAAEAVENLKNKTVDAANTSSQVVNNVKGLKSTVNETADSMGRLGTELDQVKSRIQYFLGLANAINLVKRAVRSAFNTVKELDKAMTETAVVTNYTIKDMWKQLPEYTKRANQLGVTTKEAYESATLYYQQGLNTEQAAALSTETLKMARIAGLDAAEATDRMTNALRGFNMELNATEAQRVDDVYSQLAAMSASNVDEISTAMTKVASLAHNANMEFETTAAFLSQIIESTRESAETAGTALKTVVARFSEVKKLFDKEELKGQDEEGQIIDVNRVSTALRSAGIDLNKYFLGEVGLDDIFMELASKWDSLTNIQQRYIATQAAGSRQQSRFIALMADYKRMQELVGAAYESNGASEKQFEKTQDSMQSKLARLKNAWDEFAMGLANNAVLKGAIDALTTLLQLVNKLTGAFGDGLGSFLKWGVAIKTFSSIKKSFNSGFISKAVTTVLKNSKIGQKVAENLASSTQEVPTDGGGSTTVVARPGLLANLFSREAIQRRRAARAANVDEYARLAAMTQDQRNLENGLRNMRNFMNPDQMTTPDNPSLDNVKGIAKLGLKINNGKLLGGLSQKLGKTKFAGGLGKLLGFGESGAAAGAAAGLTVGLGALVAAAGAAFTAYKLWENFSPKGQLKQATRFSNAMKDAAESAEKARQSTKKVYETYTEKDAAVQEATSISGREKAIEDRNNYINELLQQDSSYAKYLQTTFKNGKLELTLDKDSVEKAMKDAEKAAAKTAIGANLAQAMQAGKQANLYRAEGSRLGVNAAKGTLLDYDAATGETTERKMTESEIVKFLGLETQAGEQDAVMKAFAKSAYSQMISGENLGDELGNLVANVLSSTFDADQYLADTRRQHGGTWWNWTRRRGHWEDEYLKAYGTEASSDMKTADIARAVAQAGAQSEQQQNATELSQLIKSNQQLYTPILKALNGELNIKLSDNEDSILQNLIGGFKDYTQEARLAALLQFDTVKDFEDAIKASIDRNKEIQKSNIGNISTRAIKTGMTNIGLQKLFNLDPDQIAQVIGLADVAEKSLGAGFNEFFNNIPEYIDQKQFDNIKNFFGSFDLEYPLQALKKINDVISNDTNPVVQQIAKQVKEANSSIFDTGYLTQLFITSEAYEEISEDLDKLIEKNKEITATDIEELAESCKDLKTLLDETGVGAQSLAKAFTAVGTGKIGIEGITSSVLKALNATKTTTTAIDNLFKTIDEYDSGRDFGKAVDFANGKVDSLRKSLESLDFGNETFKKDYQYFFKDYEKFVNLDTAGRKSLLTQNLDRMEQLLDNDAVGAMRELATKGIVNQKDTKGFVFDWDVTGDWEDTVAQVSEALDVNTQMAETIVAAAAKHIPNLLSDMDAAGYQKTLKSFAENIQNDTVVTTQELEVMAAATGKTVDQLRTDLENTKLSLPIEVNWQKDGKNLSGDELIKEFKEKFPEIEKEFNKFKQKINKEDANDENAWAYDADKMLSSLQEQYKLSESQAKEVANNLVQGQGVFEKTVKIPVELEPGKGKWEIQDVKVQADTIEDLEAEVKLKEDQAGWTQMGQAMAEAVKAGLGGDIDITTVFIPPTNADTVTKGIDIPAVGIDTYLKSPSNTVGSHYNEFTGQYEAKGGIVSSYASGTRHIKPGIALTGEEGPELVWNKKGGYAYLVGKNGPEFADLVPGDQVFPADETNDIINRGITPSLATGGKIIPSYKEGAWDENGGRTGKGKSNNNKKKKDDKFEMDLDKYYNMVEDINELLRLRNLLETDYEQLLKEEGKTGKQIYDNLNRQLRLLRERQEITADLAEKRKQQILDLIEENKQFQEYAWWNEGDLTIEIDWELVRSVTDKDKGSDIKDYLSKLEDFQSKYDDMIENLEDIESAVQDILERGKDQYDTLEERTRDALIQQIQDKIDELEEVDKAISDTNQKLFDSMQQALNNQRQQRENAKTEEDLTDKEKRLAYLQQDSSNANAREIAKLQEELADARQNYTDTLIDQKISELQRQNDEAQEQRQEQIDLMQRSLDWQEKSGAFWETVYQYISEGTDAVGALVKQSDLEKLLMSAEPWDKLSEEQKQTWVSELMDQVAQGIAYLEMQRQLEDIGTKEGTSVSFTNFKGETLTGKVDKNGNVVVTNSDGSTTTYKDVFQDYHGAYRTFEDTGEVKPATSTAKKTSSSKSSSSKSSGSGSSNGLILEPEEINLVAGKEGWLEKGKEVISTISSAGNLISTLANTSNNTSTSPSISNKTDSVLLKDEGVVLPKINKSNEGVQQYDNPIGPQQQQQTSLTQQQKAVVVARKLVKTTYSYKNSSVHEIIQHYNDGTKLVTGTEPHFFSTNDGRTCSKCGYTRATAPTPKGQVNSLSDAIGQLWPFATGGLADFTGPAWLDGTKSHPELILNARDTQNFIELKDTLSSLKSNGGLNLNGGNNYYDITVNVDQMSSDYDVDRAIDRIKARIAQDGAYRNVNTLSRLR